MVEGAGAGFVAPSPLLLHFYIILI